MAIHFQTDDPASLLQQFDARIAQTEASGKITTWRKQDAYYTHIAPNWAAKAWLRPSMRQGWLTFNIYPSQNETVKVTAYGYYHGHLIETFLNHFDKLFTLASATPLPQDPDRVG